LKVKEVPGWKLSPETGYSEGDFSWYSSVRPGVWSNSTPH